MRWIYSFAAASIGRHNAAIFRKPHSGRFESLLDHEHGRRVGLMFFILEPHDSISANARPQS